jgi:hypothetical protein
VGVELQSVVDGDDPFGLLTRRQFGRTVQPPASREPSCT